MAQKPYDQTEEMTKIFKKSNDQKKKTKRQKTS